MLLERKILNGKWPLYSTVYWEWPRLYFNAAVNEVTDYLAVYAYEDGLRMPGRSYFVPANRLSEQTGPKIYGVN